MHASRALERNVMKATEASKRLVSRVENINNSQRLEFESNLVRVKLLMNHAILD